MKDAPAATSSIADETLVRTLKLAAAEWGFLIAFGLLALDGGRLQKVMLICALAYAIGDRAIRAAQQRLDVRKRDRRHPPPHRAGILFQARR